MLLLFTQNAASDNIQVIDCSVSFGIIHSVDLVKVADIPVVELPFGFSCSVDIMDRDIANVAYIFTLTGADDGVDDIDIPISSFQCRKRSGAATYLNVVIPGVEYAGEIAARPNATMQVKHAFYIGETCFFKKVIVEADFDSVRVDEGSTNQSIVMIGYKTLSYEARERELSGYTYFKVDGELIRYRLAEPNPDLNPGDTVIIGAHTFTVGVISMYVSVANQNFEISNGTTY